MKEDFKYLNILTKAEIIEFLKREMVFHAPTERKVVYYLWERRCDKLQKEMDNHIKSNTISELLQKRNVLTSRYNSKITVLSDRVKALDGICNIDKKIKRHHNKFGSIIKRQCENDLLLDKFNK